MTTAKELTDQLINKAKAMQTFQIVRQLDDPELIHSAGVIPFDLKMTREGRLTVSVPAMNLTDAEQQVDAWLDRLEQGDDDEWLA